MAGLPSTPSGGRQRRPTRAQFSRGIFTGEWHRVILETKEVKRRAFLKPTLEGVTREDWPHLREAKRPRRHRHAGGGARQCSGERTSATTFFRQRSKGRNSVVFVPRSGSPGHFRSPGGHWMSKQFEQRCRQPGNLGQSGRCDTTFSFLWV
ncbi:hypothetical protein E2C01_055847 [Portunus trituberculatus]|uniref:Uncharacterized protein n=1 Tax=Portunus trituberculatus TaxID=210409 RepID=A0A5B7GNV4_PORTR|nr:hypothetical protein [Portunus trituberculatus]